MTVFVKDYPNQRRCAAAHANYLWLAALHANAQFPRLVGASGRTLLFEHIDGAMPTAADIPELADVLGRVHRAAAPVLGAARLVQPYRARSLLIGDFVNSRRAALHQAARAHNLADTRVDAVLDRAAALPASIYKDANLRNFLITDAGVAIVDFDDLTLAPYGYDLAKLIVSAAMTHGHVTANQVATALERYNARVWPHACTLAELGCWAEVHWLLTARYLGRNGYTHPWPGIRPWANPL